MNYYKLLLCLSLFLFQCGLQKEKGYVESEELLSDIFTFELEFGADNLPDEFLIVNPWAPDANDSGDVFVSDESRIKVYDKDGRAKIIIGRPGQGPGEFPDQVTEPNISPTGYLTVNENTGFSIFSPEYNFIKRAGIRHGISMKGRYSDLSKREGWPPGMMTWGVISFDEDTHVYEGRVDSYNTPLIYENEDSLYIIEDYVTKLIISEGYFVSLRIKGEVLWCVPNKDKIVYLHTDHDAYHENDVHKYRLNVFNFADYSYEHYDYEYYPVSIPDSILAKEKKSLDRYRDERTKRTILNAIDDIKYHPSLKKLYTDRNLIFAVTFYQNAAGEYLTDVIDAGTGEKIKSVYFSLLPYAMRNGYAYMLGTNVDGFYVIKKYKIDPAVYER